MSEERRKLLLERRSIRVATYHDTEENSEVHKLQEAPFFEEEVFDGP